MSMFDDIIKEKADQHQSPVPPDAWDNINKEKKRRRFAFWWFGLVLLIGSGAAYWYNNATAGNEKNLTQVRSGKTIPANVSKNDLSAQPTNNNADETKGRNIAEKNSLKYTAVETGNIADVEKSSAEKIIIEKHNKSTRNNSNNDHSQGETIILKQDLANGDRKETQTTARQIATRNKNLSVNYHNKQTTISVQKIAAEKQTETTVAQKNIFGKTKSKTRVKSSQIDAAEEAADSTDKNIDNAIADDTSSKTGLKNPVVVLQGTLKDTATTLVTQHDTSKKTKTIIDTTQLRPRHMAIVRKIKTKSWFIEPAVTSLFPIENYDRSQQFNRTLFLNNTLTEFSGSLVSTKIDASVAFSLVLKKSIGKKAAIGAGLQYTQLTEHLVVSGDERTTSFELVQRLVNGTNGPELVTDTLRLVSEGKRTITATNRYQLLTLPMLLQYDLIRNKKWSLAAAGMAYINISSEYQNEIDRHSMAPLVNEDQLQSGFGLDLSIGCRVGKTLSDRLEIFAAPAFRWNVSPYNFKNNLINKSVRQAGLHFGLSYKLD